MYKSRSKKPLAEVERIDGTWWTASMVANFPKPSSETGTSSIATNGDTITLKAGEIEDFHFLSPNTDPDGMRVVGALGEILYEQLKATFKTGSMFVVAENEDYRLIMFPEKNGFAVWKTSLSVKEALETLRSDIER
jgi:hypothetical protein